MLTMMKRGALIVPSFPQNAKQESQLTQSVFTKAHNAPQKKKNAFTIWNRTWVLHVMERPIALFRHSRGCVDFGLPL